MHHNVYYYSKEYCAESRKHETPPFKVCAECNSINININERIKELATLKVLGFYDDEVSAYIYRENVILTFFGIVIGLFAGIFLNLAIVSVIDIDTVTFSTDLKWWSFLLAAFCTILFAVIVNVMMHKKLKKISMVESLKSVE